MRFNELETFPDQKAINQIGLNSQAENMPNPAENVGQVIVLGAELHGRIQVIEVFLTHTCVVTVVLINVEVQSEEHGESKHGKNDRVSPTLKHTGCPNKVDTYFSTLYLQRILRLDPT